MIAVSVPLRRAFHRDTMNELILWNFYRTFRSHPLKRGRSVSTQVAKPSVHAELRFALKTGRNAIIANDSNYALAA